MSTPTVAPNAPSHALQAAARPAGDGPAPRVALRVSTMVDADVLAEDLARLWRETPCRMRAASRVELSVVETCGRSAADRERDALRLLHAEAEGPPCAAALRATLVSFAGGDHLLLLAASPKAGAGALAALTDGLALRYPVSPVRLD